MIVINKIQLENGDLVPERQLTLDEKKNVVFTLSNATHYIYYEKDDIIPQEILDKVNS